MSDSTTNEPTTRTPTAANNGGDVLPACTPAATSADGNREAAPNANRGPARGNDARAAPADALRGNGRRVSVVGAASDEVLTPWQLHDLTGAVQSAPDDFMRAYFVRYRAVHGKGIFDVDAEALRRSWCSFVYRWNQEQLRRGFVSWLEDAEDRRQRHAIGGLREIVCSIAWDTDSNCLVDVLEGCRICGGTGSRHLTLDE